MSTRPGPAAGKRRPWGRLAVWAAIVIALGVLGTGLADRLAPTSLLVPGSPSAKAHEMLDEQFGNSVPVTVLLEGPEAQVDRQGQRLVKALGRRSDVQVMSPWSAAAGTVDALRPKPDSALIVASFKRPESEAMTVVVPAAERLVGRYIAEPVTAHVGGVAAIAVALQENALAATHRAEMLVAPILIIVLLLVFRSPVAALLPLLVGAATVIAGRGVLLLVSEVIGINALAVSIASMMGLALGVDYALLMVSRFRQERDDGHAVEAAIAIAAHAAGRTIGFAGVTLALVMVAAAFVAPGDLLSSVAAGVVVSTLLSVALANTLLPALLRVLAPHLDRWRLPSIGRGGRLLGAADRLIARPWIAIPLVALPMLALAAPAASLTIGPPDPRQLPPSDPTRAGFEALRHAIGPGWAAPFTVVATAKEGPITSPGRLEAISRWQARIARDPAVAAVIGPASLREAQRPVERLRRGYRKAPERLAEAHDGIGDLRSGLRRASDGVEALQSGLGAAEAGATELAGRTRDAERGAEKLSRGLGRIDAGAARLTDGLDRTMRGAGRLQRGQARLEGGAARLARGAEKLDAELTSSLGQVRELSAQMGTWLGWARSLIEPAERAAGQIEEALEEARRMTVGRDDPRYRELVDAIDRAAAAVGGPGAPQSGDLAAAAPDGSGSSVLGALGEIRRQIDDASRALASVPRRLDRLSGGVGRLRRGAGKVAAGASDAARGGRKIHGALSRLAAGGHELGDGLAKGRAGSDALSGGLGKLAGGADELAAGLGEGRDGLSRLAAGLARPQGPLSRYAVTLQGYQRALGAIDRRTPGAIDSGFLLLAGLDGTVPEVREQIAQVTNLDGGAQSTRMLIVPAAGPSSPRTVALSDRLRDRLPELAEASGSEVSIGEGAQSLVDYSDATLARIPTLVIVLCLVSIVMLIAVLRSLLLPLVAVALNLLTIAAAFGVLQVLFSFDLLVGPPYIDAISAAGVLTIMFALSIDYEVFLLTRMREAWLRTGDHRLAITDGLRHTAGVITGAAVIMSSVFLVFATSEIASLQQFGAGLTFAVVLDATLVRLVLLPALMRVMGRRAWWLPAWLDRRLPEIEAIDTPGEDPPRDTDQGPPSPGAGQGPTSSGTARRRRAPRSPRLPRPGLASIRNIAAFLQAHRS